MAATAFMTMYREEFISSFERRQSLLRSCCVTNAQIKGNSAVFLVAGSGSANAVTRGVNGLIPARNDDLNQYTATLAEWHDLVQRTGFNVFASQGDARRIMQETTMGVINRKIDEDILNSLDDTTLDAGNSAVPLSLSKVMHARTVLGNNNVDITDIDNMFFVASPGAMGYLMQTKEFASAEYVDVKPFVGPARKMLRWAGFNWIEHTGVEGVGTSAEKLFAFHRNAIGHAVDTHGIRSPVGYDDEQDYSWTRCTVFMGSKLIQNSGIVRVNHDASAFAST
jgi:hypothetical protein